MGGPTINGHLYVLIRRNYKKALGPGISVGMSNRTLPSKDSYCLLL